MDMYGYVAENNPSLAKAICHKYGYETVNVKSAGDLGICLQQVVAKEGEAALKDVVNNHPDKELIMEICYSENFVGADGINTAKEQQVDSNLVSAFRSEEESRRQFLSSQNNNNLLAAAFLLGVAIIAAKI